MIFVHWCLALLISEVTGVGLTLFSPCSAVSYVLCRPQAAFPGCRRAVAGAVFLLRASPVWPGPEAVPAELGWEQSIVHPSGGGTSGAQLRA